MKKAALMSPVYKKRDFLIGNVQPINVLRNALGPVINHRGEALSERRNENTWILTLLHHDSSWYTSYIQY